MSSIESEALVAVVTRTKDRPLFLERAARSVFGQHFSAFKWVIVNDGGDPAVVEALVDRHRHEAGDRIQLIHQPSSLGMQNAANVGITKSASTYVVIHDDDDTWDARFLDRTIAHLEYTGAMGVATVTDRVIEQIDGEDITILEKTRMFPGMRAINIYRMCYENQFAPIAFLFRRKVFEAIGYFDQDLRGYGDWDFHLRFLEHYDVDYLDAPEALAFYHQRPEAIGVERNSVFSDDQQALADKMFNKWLRADLERGRLGLGFVVNSLRNGPVDPSAAVNAIMVRIDEQADQVVQVLGERIEECTGSLSDSVAESSMRLEDAMGRQHKGLVPFSHRLLLWLRRVFARQQ